MVIIVAEHKTMVLVLVNCIQVCLSNQIVRFFRPTELMTKQEESSKKLEKLAKIYSEMKLNGSIYFP